MAILKTFTCAIQEIQEQIIKMAKLADKELKMAVDSLVSDDKSSMDEVVKSDLLVDKLDNNIQSSILQLIMLQPPTPEELRTLTTMMRISREFERVGDLAVNIAKISKKTLISKNSELFTNIKEMSNLTGTMLTETIHVLKNKNVKEASLIAKTDDQVDHFFQENQFRIILEMKRETDQIEMLANLLLINRFIERSADHVVNVSRQVARDLY